MQNLFQIVMPVFNEQDILNETLIHAKEAGYIDRLIVVNDASTDATRLILNKWELEEGLKTIHLTQNKRKEGAIKEALEALKLSNQLKEYTVLIDADTYLESSSSNESISQLLNKAISSLEADNYSAFAFRLNAVFLHKPSIFWMSAFTTYIGIQFDNWLLSKQKQLWVINGAAGMFRTDDLLHIFKHMEFNFETGDLQITVDLMKQKKPIAFHKHVIANSYVPSTFTKFFNQRRRWERGTTKVLWQDKAFYAGSIFPASFMGLSLLIHLSIYISFWVALISGILDNFQWNWGIRVFLYSYVGWFIFDLAKGFWVIYKEKYSNYLLYFLCEVMNGPVTIFVIIPARLLGGMEALIYLFKKFMNKRLAVGG
ncbi:glycosyltransferase family 2 protein [Polynucleobacter paneuropaeus]|nr:glycosyltransferase family 2 protein [Polynucleobacter paneuropaeus]MBT8599361.1 glycosyltransferase family 2 protein [Polynucleobacter paneuropaeus]